MRFQNSFVTTDLCAPSRSSLLAAKYSHTTGVHDNGGSDGGFIAFNDVSTLPVWLKAAGYHTGLYGKYINGYNAGRAVHPARLGRVARVQAGRVLRLHARGQRHRGRVRQRRRRLLDRRAARPRGAVHPRLRRAQQPFFLYFAPKAPHAPATPAPRHAGMFSAIPPWRPPNYNEADVSDKPAWVQAIAPWGANKQTNQDAFDRKQLESLQAVDEAVAALLQALTDIGQLDNTIIIFASDNGYSWGSHRWEPKQCEYEECMRVPLAIRYKPLAPLPRVETGFGLNIDHGLTLAELAGATPDPGAEGVSMVRLLDGTAPSWRTDFLEEHWDGTPGDETDVGSIPTYAEVRGTPWKYNELVTGETELYDIVADPFELTNVGDRSRQCGDGRGAGRAAARAPARLAGLPVGSVRRAVGAAWLRRRPSRCSWRSPPGRRSSSARPGQRTRPVAAAVPGMVSFAGGKTPHRVRGRPADGASASSRPTSRPSCSTSIP